MCDANTLLNANYYMLDITSPDGNVHISDGLKYDDNGQLTVTNDTIEVSPVTINQYYIKYGNRELDPAPFVTTTLMCTKNEFNDPYSLFQKHLNNTDTMLAVYEFIFRHELRGNKLQILIISDDETVCDFGDMICQYLAHNFGADITFIDPSYRPNVHGQSTYTGDKAFAQKNIQDIRDAQLVIAFNQILSQTGYDESLSNLTVWLNAFDFNNLIHLYNLLFSNDPLPPDNYTADHIKQIIIGRVAQTLPKNSNPFQNLYMSDEYFKLLEKYEANEEVFDDVL